MTEYIHWSLKNYSGDAPINLGGEAASIKKKIEATFFQNFKKTGSNSKSLTNEQIIKELRIISKESNLGDKIAGLLNDNDNTSYNLTGSGFTKKVKNEEGGIPDIPDEAAKISKEIQNYLDSLIPKLFRAGQLSLANEILTAIPGVTTLSPEVIKKYNNQKISESQLSLANLELEKDIQKIRMLNENLQIYSKTGVPSDISLKSIVKSLQGCFANIGGKMLEPVAVHGANLCGEEIRKEIRTINQVLNQSPIMTVTSTSTGQNKNLSGKSQKGDMSMQWGRDGLTWTAYGSVKHSGENSYSPIKGQPLRGSIPDIHSGYNLRKFIETTYEGYPSPFSGFDQYLGSKNVRGAGSFSSQARSAWSSIKKVGKYKVFAEALTGQGIGKQSQGDFASLLIINARVFSMYDVLHHMIENFDDYGSITGSGAALLDTKLNIIRKNISGNLKRDNNEGESRSKETRARLNSFYSNEIIVNLKLKSLGTLDI